MKITIITNSDRHITYKGDVTYTFNDEVITISHPGNGIVDYADSYRFKDLNGIIINIKRNKDADKR